MILNAEPQRLGLLAPQTTPSTRQRELEAGLLVLRAAGSREPFIVRRAAYEAGLLADSPARRALVRATEAIGNGDRAGTRAGLVSYGAVLERHGLHEDARAIYCGVLEVYGPDATVALHAGRAARKSGDRAEAMRLYGVAANAARGDRALELYAAIGRALVSNDALAELSAVVADARRERRWEAFAVAREERARLHRQAGRPLSALRDYAAAGRRYSDPIDRIRVLHAIADVLSARGDLAGAREALLIAHEFGRGESRAYTLQRLRTVARAMNDQLELRRSRGQGLAAMVALAPRGRAATRSASYAPRLRRLRNLIA